MIILHVTDKILQQFACTIIGNTLIDDRFATTLT